MYCVGLRIEDNSYKNFDVLVSIMRGKVLDDKNLYGVEV